jgi:hypothetical protein
LTAIEKKAGQEESGKAEEKRTNAKKEGKGSRSIVEHTTKHRQSLRSTF